MGSIRKVQKKRGGSEYMGHQRLVHGNDVNLLDNKINDIKKKNIEFVSVAGEV
jgi:hypothetical protein